MTKANRQGPVLLVGGTGRLGGLVRHHWPKERGLLLTRRRLPVLPEEMLWNPQDGPAGLLDALARTGQQPVSLVMLAGVTPGPGVDGAGLQRNRLIAVKCLEAAQAAGISRVLLASSAAVYGSDGEGHPFLESDPPAPFSPYGQAKLEMEQAAQPFRAAGMNICALRIGNVAGADALLHPLSGILSLAAAERVPVRIDAFADGLGPLRSYIGAETLARVLERLASLKAPLPDVVNVAAPVPIRMRDLAEAAGWPHEMVKAPPAARQSITMDCQRLMRLCPVGPDENTPDAMVAQWKAALPA